MQTLNVDLRMKNLLASIMSAVILLCHSASAFAWGERGHDLVTRVAARLLAEDKEHGSQLANAFVPKEHMLAHLANVPDIVWRNIGKEVEDINGPTHYVDLEYITMAPNIATLPRTPAESEAAMKKLCAEKPAGYVCPDEQNGAPKASAAGTAPFRVRQLANMMQAAFQRAKETQKDNGEAGGKAFTAAVNDALFYGGILSHFVGDLANPYHTTRDYNGYEVGAGGVHGYFESDIVNSFDLKWDSEVFARAQKLRDLARLKKILAGQKDGDQDPLLLAWAQSIESFDNLKKLQDMDFKFAVTKKGSNEKGLKIRAERKPPGQVARFYRDVATDRVAQGAATLAWIWKNAWIRGGKPDLSGFASYDYRTTPDFISPDY
jgi:hypothetical protein